MPLRELKARIGSTRGQDVPTKRMLWKNSEPLDAYVSGDYRLTVFMNGFVLAETGRRYTVIRIDECMGYTCLYPASTLTGKEFAQPCSLTEEEFLDQPWPIRIMLTADDQFERNNDRCQRGLIGRHSEVPDDKRWMCGRAYSFEDEAITRIDREATLGKMTDRKRQIYKMSEAGYTQQEIGEKLGTSRNLAKKGLARSRTDLRKMI